MSAQDRPFAKLRFAHEYALEGSQGPHLRAEYLYGGPATREDRRLIFSRQELRQLLARADASLTGRVILPFCGVRVRVFEDADGHHFEVLTLEAGEPRPEMTELRVKLPGPS